VRALHMFIAWHMAWDSCTGQAVNRLQIIISYQINDLIMREVPAQEPSPYERIIFAVLL